MEDNESAIYEDIDEVIPQYLESLFNPLVRPLDPIQEQAYRCEESAMNTELSLPEIGMNENEAYEPIPGSETTDSDTTFEDKAEADPICAVRYQPTQNTVQEVL